MAAAHILFKILLGALLLSFRARIAAALRLLLLALLRFLAVRMALRRTSALGRRPLNALLCLRCLSGRFFLYKRSKIASEFVLFVGFIRLGRLRKRFARLADLIKGVTCGLQVNWVSCTQVV